MPTIDPYDAFDEHEPAPPRRRFSRGQLTVLAALAALVLVAGAIVALDDGDGPPQQVSAGGDDTDPPAQLAPGSTSTTEVDDPTSTTTSTTVRTTTTTLGSPVLDAEPPPHLDLHDRRQLVGRAVDPEGRPLPDITVYSGTPSPGGTNEGRTDSDGYYQIACPTEPLVLSGVVISTNAGDHRYDQNFVPTEVVHPAGASLGSACGSGDVLVTTLHPGAVIEGVVIDPDWRADDPNPGYNIWGVRLELFDLPWAPTVCEPGCFYLEILTTPGPEFAFRAVGVPTGDHPLHLPGRIDGAPAPAPVLVSAVAGHTTRVELHAPPGRTSPG